jgi:hypothetical protein
MATRTTRRLLAGVLLCASLLTLVGCESPKTYESAFSQKTALAGNTRNFDAPADQVFRASKVTLVQQGFTIEQADASVGLLKGLRTFDDPKNKKIAYLVTASVDINGTSAQETVVTVSASQQTVLHKDSNKYYHLLGLVPIPTGKEYQTVIRAEGNITGSSFYQDFFAAVSRNVAKVPVSSPGMRLSAVRANGAASDVVQPPPKSDAIASPADLPTATAAPNPLPAAEPAITGGATVPAESPRSVTTSAEPTGPATKTLSPSNK